MGPLPLGDLKPLQVDEWLRGLRERGLGDRTIAYARSVLRRTLQFVVEWEILDRNPAGALFRAAKRKRTVKPGGKKIVSSIRTKRAGSSKPLKAARMRLCTPSPSPPACGSRKSTGSAGVMSISTTGSRRSTRWSQKTRGKKGDTCTRIEFGPPKTDKFRRTLDFSPFVAELLAEHRRDVRELRRFAGDRWQDHGLAFPSQVGTPLEERNVLRRFQKICESVGLPRLRLYDLRHTHASLLIHEGAHPQAHF